MSGMRFRVSLVVWTLVIWGSRVRNIIADVELTGLDRWLSLGVAGALLIAALVTGVAVLTKATWQRLPLGILVVGGIVRWTIRGPLILVTGDWSFGFRAVHTVLWLVTVVLSVAAWREGRGVGTSGSS